MIRIALTSIALVLLLAGCGSTVKAGAAKSMTCPELDNAVSNTSEQISTSAINLGRIDSYNPPRWLLGAGRTRQALADRQGRKIDEARAVQSEVKGERASRCR